MEDIGGESANQVSRRIVGGTAVDTTHWPTPDEGALGVGKRAQYIARKQAVILYLSGASSEAIKRSTALCAKQAYRLIRERCLETHADGRPYGRRGLLPYFRIKPYKRHKKIQLDPFGAGGAGAMQAVLDQYPELRIEFEAKILKGFSSNKLAETRRSRRRHCAWFLHELRRLGCASAQLWPFNTASLGYYSVCRYIDRVLATDPRALAAATGSSTWLAPERGSTMRGLATSCSRSFGTTCYTGDPQSIMSNTTAARNTMPKVR